MPGWFKLSARVSNVVIYLWLHFIQLGNFCPGVFIIMFFSSPNIITENVLSFFDKGFNFWRTCGLFAKWSNKITPLERVINWNSLSCQYNLQQCLINDTNSIYSTNLIEIIVVFEIKSLCIRMDRDTHYWNIYQSDTAKYYAHQKQINHHTDWDFRVLLLVLFSNCLDS